MSARFAILAQRGQRPSIGGRYRGRWAPALAFVLCGALLFLPRATAGQEVAGDVAIPPPREMVTSTPAASGLGRGAVVDGADGEARYREAVTKVLARVRAGELDEEAARDLLGDVVVSLLVKRGVLSFRGRTTPKPGPPAG